jgi:hypothetical protein
MSVDYNISIYRKQDNKLIGKVLCNMLKNILDSEYSNYIHCDGRMSAHNVKFEYEDLHTLDLTVESKIESAFLNIFEKKLMITCANNATIKEELEQDIYTIKDNISELYVIHYSSAYIQGMISTIVEDNLKNPKQYDEMTDDEISMFDIPAYKYNYEDLKTDNHSTIWNDDVYCVIEAS